MKNILLFIALMGVTSVIANCQDKLTADNSKTTLVWLGEKVTGQHIGTIKLRSGWLNWKENKILSGEFLIDMKTIVDADSTAKLIGHLKSDDFFGVEKFPFAKLLITGSTAFDKGSGVVQGTLTIKGITNPIEFKSNMQKKDDGIWFYSNIIIDRTKFNVRYGSGSFFDNLGDKVIYDEFKLKVALFVK
jgi:polyisoprenoid-binding protein YceI